MIIINIFILDRNPRKCAEFHCDKHVVKMILESAQLLSSAHHLTNSIHKDKIYKLTHQNHPCAIWVRASKKNYSWLYELFCMLLVEYNHRYHKIHKSEKLLEYLSVLPNLPDTEMTSFFLAMPDEYKDIDPVLSYRKYYKYEKERLLNYKNRDKPYWL